MIPFMLMFEFSIALFDRSTLWLVYYHTCITSCRRCACQCLGNIGSSRI